MTKKSVQNPISSEDAAKFTEVYKPGQEMQLVDTLSWNYLPETKEVVIEDLDVCKINLNTLTSL